MDDRMMRYFELSREAAQNPPQDSFEYDRHRLALQEYRHLDPWEKYARSMAGAIVNQKVYVWPEDRIFGHVYYDNARSVEKKDPDLDDIREYRERGREEFPCYDEFLKYQLFCSGSQGHIAWDWNVILRQGTAGLRRRCEQGLKQ